MTVSSVSAIRVKGRWYFSLNAFWAATSSWLTPITATPLLVRAS